MPLPGPAIADPRTRAALRRDRRTGRLLLLAGAVLLAVFLAGLSRSQRASNELEAHGARTPGVVLDVWRRGRGPSQVTVAYDADRRRVGKVNVASPARGYRAGQRVSVLYSRSAPARMTIAGESNVGYLTQILLATLFIGFAFPTGRWAYRVWRRTRWRRVLAHAGWRESAYRHASVRGGYAILLARDAEEGVDPEPWGLKPIVVATSLHARSPDRLWIATAGDRAVLAPPGATCLYGARRARSARERARWDAGLQRTPWWKR